MKVLVMGSGGIGGYYGSLLDRAGHNVTFIARGDHFDAIAAKGLSVESQNEPPVTLKVDVLSNPRSGEPFDLILFSVKTYDTQEAIELISDAISPKTLILTFQNGFESGIEISSLIQKGTVLEGPAYTVCSVKSPGVIQQVGNVNKLIIGPMNRTDLPRVKLLLAELTSSGWPVVLTEFPQRELWSKLVFLGPLAALTTITSLTAGKLRSNKFTLKIIEGMMNEYALVGNVCGADLADDVVKNAMNTLHLYPANGSTSMARDKSMGKKMEIESLLGSVINKGRGNSIDTPITSLIYGLLNPSI